MFGAIKSIGSKAMQTIGKGSKVKIQTPSDQHLQKKLQQISSQILKAEPQQQFKIYQQLQSENSANFNRTLRTLYEWQGTQTQTLNSIVKFYTFLLTNCKNELVICKLVSEPLVIQLTKIVLEMPLQSQQRCKQQDCLNDQVHRQKSPLKQLNQEVDLFPIKQSQKSEGNTEQQTLDQVKNSKQQQTKRQESTAEVNKAGKQQQNIDSSQEKKLSNSHLPSPSSSQQKSSGQILQSLHYINYIDWQQVNAYKVALIRSYINCINPETVKYMIVDNQLPIFGNCIQGYKHYLSDGVEGTCISNCILMILTKVNHNEEVCEIIFDPSHRSRSKSFQARQQLRFQQIQKPQKLSKSISKQKFMKLHDFISDVIVYISEHIDKVLQYLLKQEQKQRQKQKQKLCQRKKLQSTSTSPQLQQKSQLNLVVSAEDQNLNEREINQSLLLGEHRKMQLSMEFIQSNMLFCADVINSINNYNYTFKMKEALGTVIQQKLIGKIIKWMSRQGNEMDGNLKGNNGQEKMQRQITPVSVRYCWLSVSMLKLVLNLSVVCQAQKSLVQFLNLECGQIWKVMLAQNNRIFSTKKKINQENKQNKSHISQSGNSFSAFPRYMKEQLTVICDCTLILVKQTVSPHSRLASRKKLEVDEKVIALKERIISSALQLLEQISQSQLLRENICLKAIRNLLLAVFCLTISSGIGVGVNGNNGLFQQSESSLNGTTGTTEAYSPLRLKYCILVLHRAFTTLLRSTLTDNRNWQFLVGNYEKLMRSVPQTILSAQQDAKGCHFHRGNNCHLQDTLRDRIMVCEAVRNYRYMIVKESTLDKGLIRLEHLYHKHFLSPGWHYSPGEVAVFNAPDEYRLICQGFLLNNQSRLPIDIIQDNQCFLVSHRVAMHRHRIVANIRFKQINSFVPDKKHMVRLKLQGIQELLMEFSGSKPLHTFTEYINEKRNKAREKELKFINYYLLMYHKDSEDLIQGIYTQQIVESGGMEVAVEKKGIQRKEEKQMEKKKEGDMGAEQDLVEHCKVAEELKTVDYEAKTVDTAVLGQNNVDKQQQTEQTQYLDQDQNQQQQKQQKQQQKQQPQNQQNQQQQHQPLSQQKQPPQQCSQLLPSSNNNVQT